MSFASRSAVEQGRGAGEFLIREFMSFNLGADFDLTPKLRGLRKLELFEIRSHEPLELLLFQRPIRHSIGTDVGAGFEYRPPLSENIVIRAGRRRWFPDKALQDIL